MDYKVSEFDVGITTYWRPVLDFGLVYSVLVKEAYGGGMIWQISFQISSTKWIVQRHLVNVAEYHISYLLYIAYITWQL